MSRRPQFKKCAVCKKDLTGRQRLYCSDTCCLKAWKARKHEPAPAKVIPITRTKGASRSKATHATSGGPSAPPPEQPIPPYGRNRIAAEATLAALREESRLEQVDEARVAAFRSLADMVDTYPTEAPLWREMRIVESALREVHDDTDAFAQLLENLRTEVGN